MMNNLSSHVRSNFNGLLVVGDTHSDFDSISRAFEYARSRNYFFVSLGDLCDRGPKPYETVQSFLSWMQQGLAGFVVGNHDNKFYRLYHGANVRLSYDAEKTLSTVGAERKSDFLRMYSEIVGMPVFSNTYHIFDDIVLVHAASHNCLWDSDKKFTESSRSRMLYGETNGEVYEDGYPVRLYNWVKEIPMGKTVIAGHDMAPIHNVLIHKPLVETNENGGRAVFMDTGCGKGGFMSGVVLTFDKKFKIDHYMEFK